MKDLALYEFVAPIERGFPLRYIPRVEGAYEKKWHEHIELLYYTSDSGAAVCNGKKYTVGRGDVIFVNSCELHETLEGVCTCLRIAPSFFEDVDFENVVICNHIENDSIINECFERIAAEYEQKSIGYDMEVKGIVYRMMRHILKNYKYEKTESKKGESKINGILSYIARNCHKKLTTSSISEHFHISENYLCHIFKNATGVSLVDYINKFRIEKSAALLLNTDESITDISFRVGFEDSNYFSRVFKKYMDTSPREYRNAGRK